MTKNDFSFYFFILFYLFFFFFEVCLRQIREYFYGNFYLLFLHFSFLCFIMGIYIFMTLWPLTMALPALTYIQKQLSNKRSFSQLLYDIKNSEDFELSRQRKKYVKLSHINLSWKPSFKETRAILIFAYHPIISSFMSLHYICPDNLKN